jgi:hypothetical protein
VLLFTVIVAAAGLLPTSANAYLPYNTNYRDGFDRLIWTQSAYYPIDILGKEIYVPDPKEPEKMVYAPLAQPKDIFIDGNDNIYIADTGNSRIVQLDPKGDLIRVLDVKESPLKKPEGLYVDKNGDIYVADTGNKRVVRLDSDGKLIKEFKRPESKFLPESFKYDPIKLVVDKRGFLYIATLGGYQGLLQLDPDGKFQSFFGANKTVFSVADAMKRMLYTREMYLREISKLPGSVASVTIDDNGFIYTVTKDIAKGQIKKLNIAGKDLLAAKTELDDTEVEKVYGEVRFTRGLPANSKPQLSDLTVDKNGNITAIDSSLKYMNQYDANGNLLFFWSGDSSSVSSKLGLVKTPSAVANNSKNELFILDEENGAVHQLRLSEFGELVHKANQLTLDGKYLESEKPWREVLRLNGFYNPAMLGLGKASYKKGDFEAAKNFYLQAGNQRGYSDSFWQIRLTWFQNNFSTLMNVFIIVVLGYILANKFTRKTKWRRKWNQRGPSRHLVWEQLKHSFYILRHPIDGFSALRYEGKGSFASSMIILLLAIASFAIYRIYTSFTFNPSVILDQGAGTVLLQFIIFWLGWIVSNFLISNIYRGEGRFKDVVYGSAYAFTPIVLIGIPVTLISKAMTLNEVAIFNFLETGMTVWVALLLFWKVQSLQNYGVGETVMNIFMSIVTMIIIGVLIFITFGLSNEMFDFFYSIFQEVTIR